MIPSDLHFDDATVRANTAYMFLYATWNEGEPFWPVQHFDAPGSLADIQPLLDRGHAEPFGKGYRMTPAGRTYWDAHRLAWLELTSRGSGIRHDSHGTRLLLTMADGQWHSSRTFPTDIRNSARYELLNTFSVEQQRDENGQRFRITPYGWQRLLTLKLVDPSNEPHWDTSEVYA